MQLMVTLGILFINVNCSTNWKGWLPVKSNPGNIRVSLVVSPQWSLHHISRPPGRLDDLHAEVSDISRLQRKCWRRQEVPAVAERKEGCGWRIEIIAGQCSGQQSLWGPSPIALHPEAVRQASRYCPGPDGSPATLRDQLRPVLQRSNIQERWNWHRRVSQYDADRSYSSSWHIRHHSDHWQVWPKGFASHLRFPDLRLNDWRRSLLCSQWELSRLRGGGGSQLHHHHGSWSAGVSSHGNLSLLCQCFPTEYSRWTVSASSPSSHSWSSSQPFLSASAPFPGYSMLNSYPRKPGSVTGLYKISVFIFSCRQSPPPSVRCSTGWFPSWLLCWFPSLVTPSALLPATSYSPASPSSEPSSSSSSCRRPRGKLKTKLENIFPRNIKVCCVVLCTSRCCSLFILHVAKLW